MCLADPDQIAQVFWNLARNGLEAMPDGGRLEVALRRDGGDVVLTVRDQGRGMGRDEQRRLFEPFRRRTGRARASAWPSSSRSSASTAATSRSAARPGQGTQFDVRLPLVSGARRPHERAVARLGRSRAAGLGAGARGARHLRRRARAVARASTSATSTPTGTRTRGPPRARWPRGRAAVEPLGRASARRSSPTPASSSPTRRPGCCCRCRCRCSSSSSRSGTACSPRSGACRARAPARSAGAAAGVAGAAYALAGPLLSAVEPLPPLRRARPGCRGCCGRSRGCCGGRDAPPRCVLGPGRRGADPRRLGRPVPR